MSYPSDQYPMVYLPLQQPQGPGSQPMASIPQNPNNSIYYSPGFYYGPPAPLGSGPSNSGLNPLAPSFIPKSRLGSDDNSNNNNINNSNNNGDNTENNDDKQSMSVNEDDEGQQPTTPQQTYSLNIYNLPTRFTTKKNLRELLIWILEDENNEIDPDSLITSLQLYKSSGNEVCWSNVRVSDYNSLFKLLNSLNGYSFQGNPLRAMPPPLSLAAVPPGPSAAQAGPPAAATNHVPFQRPSTSHRW
ncbi:unnamed protein product [Ambrosiozyma monospora]|uniref:Unnamed protein product n=1 Tax=Ambrosiozyma monospora TaxID=43982 RepID=A0A9W6Z4F8_AMBMO|nr:unnamed protein product [Ambrosiozyma monospora]